MALCTYYSGWMSCLILFVWAFFAELWGTGREWKIQNENISLKPIWNRIHERFKSYGQCHFFHKRDSILRLFFGGGGGWISLGIKLVLKIFNTSGVNFMKIPITERIQICFTLHYVHAQYACKFSYFELNTGIVTTCFCIVNTTISMTRFSVLDSISIRPPQWQKVMLIWWWGSINPSTGSSRTIRQASLIRDQEKTPGIFCSHSMHQKILLRLHCCQFSVRPRNWLKQTRTKSVHLQKSVIQMEQFFQHPQYITFVRWPILYCALSIVYAKPSDKQLAHVIKLFKSFLHLHWGCMFYLQCANIKIISILLSVFYC